MRDDDPVLVDDVVRAAHRAMSERDWDALRLMLHPYLHWTTAGGDRLRGRTKVMARLQATTPPTGPIAVELRDGQIYRWQEPPEESEA
jgi:SnoaL-like domain